MFVDQIYSGIVNGREVNYKIGSVGDCLGMSYAVMRGPKMPMYVHRYVLFMHFYGYCIFMVTVLIREC